MSETDKHGSQTRTLYVEDRLWQEMKDLAKTNERSLSGEIRRALRLYVVAETARLQEEVAA